jgi:hypothetical protein
MQSHRGVQPAPDPKVSDELQRKVSNRSPSITRSVLIDGAKLSLPVGAHVNARWKCWVARALRR